MRRAVALALVLVAAGCGSHASKQGATARVATSTPQPVRVTISAPTHHPSVKAKWPVTVRVTNATGKPIGATLTMRILLGGTPVGKVDNGRVYHIVGTWREKKGEEITWPQASRGQSLQFQAIITSQHMTVKRTYAVTPR